MALWRRTLLCSILTGLLWFHCGLRWSSAATVAAASGEQSAGLAGWRQQPAEPDTAGATSLQLFLPLVTGANGPLPAPPTPQLLPGTVAVPPPIENAVTRILSESNNLPPGVELFAITDLEARGRWRFVSVAGLANVPGDQKWNLLDHGHWFGLILLHEQSDGGWQGALEGTAEFSRLLAVASAQTKNMFGAALDPHGQRSQLAESYILPWEAGTRMQYGTRGVHDNEFSAITPGWKAVDFLSDGNTALGHAPNRLLAATSGTITYKCSPRAGENSAAIRVGNLMYTHLLNSASLTVGRTFTQGEVIGPLKTGSFSEACGYASQGAAWFHVHWGFPNTGVFSAGGWTLDLADQKWRRGSAVEGIGAWLLAEGIPAPPIPVSPGPGEIVAERSVQFSWQSPNAPGQNGYSLRLSPSANPDAQPWLVDTSLPNGQTSYTHTFAADGPFFWHIRTWNLSGQSSAWATQAFTIDTAPICPSGLLAYSAAIIDAGSCPLPDPPLLHSPVDGALFDEGQVIDFAWQANPHADVYWGEISGGPAGALSFGWTAAVTQTFSAPAAGFMYAWRVRARNLAGESVWSESWGFTVRPAAPAGLLAQAASCSQVNLLWIDTSTAEEGFLIYRDGMVIGQVGPNATYYQDVGLLPESSYTYTVTTFAGGIESGFATASVETGICDAIPLVNSTATPAELVVMGGDLITTSYTFSTTGIHAVQLDQYMVRFMLADGATLLGDPDGPFDLEVTIPAGGAAVWEAEVYLPPEVVVAARSAGATALLLGLTFTGQDDLGHSVLVEHRLPLRLDTCSDPAEPNETPAQATPIITGVAHPGVICPVADRDHYRVAGVAGAILVAGVVAARDGSLLDALLELYDPVGDQLLSMVDDSDGSPDPRLVFELPADGEYFVSVRSVSPIAAGVNYSYTLTVTLDTESPVATVVHPVTDAWLHAFRQVIEVDATDAETGVERVEFYLYEAGADEPFWTWLGTDADGSDGWQLEWDTSALPVQQGMELRVVVYDGAGRSTVVTVAGLRLERTPPVVAARIEPETEGPGLAFWVVWEDGFDDKSGLASYDIQLRDGPDGEWIDWLVGVAATRSLFTGEQGHTYFFRARARDQAGNQSKYREGDGDTWIEVPDLTPPDGTFLINGGAQYTNNRLVTLTLTVADIGLGVDQMEIVEGNEFSSTQWLSPVPTVTWELSAEEGTKILSVRWRDRAGNVSVGITQSIILDTIAPTGGLTLVDSTTIKDGYVLLRVTVNEDLAGVQMRLRTDDGEWSDWMPAVEALYWSLEADATHITVQFSDLAGNLSDLYEVTLAAATPVNWVFLPLIRLDEALALDDEIPPH